MTLAGKELVTNLSSTAVIWLCYVKDFTARVIKLTSFLFSTVFLPVIILFITRSLVGEEHFQW